MLLHDCCIVESAQLSLFKKDQRCMVAQSSTPILLFHCSSHCDVSSLTVMGTRPDKEYSSSLTRYVCSSLLHNVVDVETSSQCMVPCVLTVDVLYVAGLFLAGCCQLQTEGEVLVLRDPADHRQLQD